jgi:hypothetical protein
MTLDEIIDTLNRERAEAADLFGEHDDRFDKGRASAFDRAISLLAHLNSSAGDQT